ncbi:uncharacterized protein LOC136022004 isoform X2 [Lathamus discolor]|uniref:uncharacterized protein LOC136022004 isoform X2 n=1 Tax=Lathamus discolor TaxID=678569 RepID=UPI0032B807F0
MRCGSRVGARTRKCSAGKWPLSHALSFPALLHLVSFTCSLHWKNEDVVGTVLQEQGSGFSLLLSSKNYTGRLRPLQSLALEQALLLPLSFPDISQTVKSIPQLSHLLQEEPPLGAFSKAKQERNIEKNIRKPVPAPRPGIKAGHGRRAEHCAEPCRAQLQPCTQIPQLHSTMKVSAAALVALLLVAARSPSEAHIDAVPTTCCFTYHQRPIPRCLITSAYIISSSCSQPGVIMVTKKELCTDPRAAWVQAQVQHFRA